MICAFLFLDEQCGGVGRDHGGVKILCNDFESCAGFPDSFTPPLPVTPYPGDSIRHADKQHDDECQDCRGDKELQQGESALAACE